MPRCGIDDGLAKRELKKLHALDWIEPQHTGQVVQDAG
jgi:hypothetical protein